MSKKIPPFLVLTKVSTPHSGRQTVQRYKSKPLISRCIERGTEMKFPETFETDHFNIDNILAVNTDWQGDHFLEKENVSRNIKIAAAEKQKRT